jgi:hypothetical protein
MEKVLKITTSFILVLNLMACHTFVANSNNQISSKETLMTKFNDNLLSKVTLMAKEETLPPLGVPKNPNRDIGFASVFVRLENPQEKTIKVMIEKIEIRNEYDGKLQFFTFSPQTIELKPLENSEIAFQLSNKIGYGGQEKVKAIVTYRIGNQVKVIDSEAVSVDYS